MAAACTLNSCAALGKRITVFSDQKTFSGHFMRENLGFPGSAVVFCSLCASSEKMLCSLLSLSSAKRTNLVLFLFFCSICSHCVAEKRQVKKSYCFISPFPEPQANLNF